MKQEHRLRRALSELISGVGLSLFFISVALASHSADLNGDGKVDAADLAVLKTQWGSTGIADLNHNGTVNAQDAGMLFSSWGTLPTATCNTGTVGTNQLVGCLWDGTNFNTADGNASSGPTLASPVPTTATALDINWGTTGPNTTVGSDTFSARWKGTFTFPAGTFTFTGGSDDGMRVKLNGVTKIDQWVNRSYTETSFSQTFSAQTTVTLEIDYFENGGDARVNFRWISSALPPPTGTRDPFLWPFATDSPWNMPIGTGAVYSTVTGNWNLDSIDAYFNVPLSSGPLAGWPNSAPLWKAKSSDPLRTLTVTNSAMPNIDPNNANFVQWIAGPVTYQIRIPDGAVASGPLTQPYSTDAVMLVLDPDGRTVHELYGARKDANGIDWKSYDLYRYDVRLDGYGKSPYGYSMPDGDKRVKHTARASGLQMWAGHVRPGELRNGIKHALAIAVNIDQLNKNGPGGRSFTWPASGSDDASQYASVGNVYMGSLLAIPASVNLDALPFQTVEGKNMARAMQQYGLYIGDTGGGQLILGVDYAAANEVPNQGSSYSGPSPFGQDLRLAAKYLKVVTNNGPNSVGGGGTPLAPLAPPLAP